MCRRSSVSTLCMAAEKRKALLVPSQSASPTCESWALTPTQRGLDARRRHLHPRMSRSCVRPHHRSTPSLSLGQRRRHYHHLHIYIHIYICDSRITTMSRAPPTATLALIAYFDHLTPCADTGELSRQDDIYEKIVGSIAPSIFGSDDIKKAVACLLFGGSTKLLPDLVRLRGDINVLLLGDPGTAKSQMLKFAEQVCTSQQLSPLCCLHFVCLSVCLFPRPAMNTCKNACIHCSYVPHNYLPSPWVRFQE